MKIIKTRNRKVAVSYRRAFEWLDCPGSGFAFPCNENGVLDSLPPAAKENFAFCLAHPEQLADLGIEKTEQAYTEPAIGLCNRCGREIALQGFTNTCDCGLDYNMSGQQLADRSQWGEETGEHWTDCY